MFQKGITVMVYCTKCGVKNEDEASNCGNCGAPLKVYSPEKRGWEEEIEIRAEEFGERAEKFGKRMENECFGLPQGGAIFGLFIGIIIILVGLQQLLGWNIDFGPFAIIIVGLLFAAGAIYGLSRRRI